MQRFFSDERAARIRGIPRPSGHQTQGIIEYPTVSSLVGVIVSRRLATLYELQTVYSLDDAVDLYEIAAVNNYNEWRASEEVRRK